MNSYRPYINIHSHLLAEDGAIAVINAVITSHPITEAPVSAGIHPLTLHETLNIKEALDKLNAAANLPNVVAIGECGLDRLAASSIHDQEQIFIEQIKIAQRVNKPLIIHCVKAFDDLIRIKKKSNAEVPFIVHGYNNNLQIAKELLKNGFYLSFGKALLRTGSNAQKAIMLTGFSSLFLETDNAPITIKSIFEKAANLKEIPVEELKEKIILNFKSLFNYA